MSTTKTNLLRRHRARGHGGNYVAFLGARFGGILDKSLANEISRIERERLTPTPTCFGRCSRKCRQVLHSKLMRNAIVILTVIDCSLLTCSLILTLTVVNESGEDVLKLATDSASQTRDCFGSENGLENRFKYRHTVLLTVAHGFVYSSLSTVTLLLLVTFVKILCFGKRLLYHPFEVYDACVVAASFIVDAVLIERSTSDAILENARVISIIIPLKVLRVVNSMILALYDNQHNKLLLMFKSKLYHAQQVTQLTADVAKVQEVLTGLEDLAMTEGVPYWEINKVVGDKCMESKSKTRTNAVRTLVAMAVGNAIDFNIKFHKNFDNLTSTSLESAVDHADSLSSDV